jgi:DNA-binding GntR family transcriptional regulator
LTKRETGGRGRETGSRSAKVYEALLERIRKRDLEPGMRVREEAMAAMLDVSRTPVREALARLQMRGLVENAPGGLAIVELNRPQTMELYALRAVLEGAAARFAAENASSSDLANLRYVCRRFADFEGSASEFARLNRIFHDAIYEAAHNRYLMRMLEELHDSLALLPDTTFSYPGRSDAAKGEHLAVLAGIEARDPDSAEKAARSHIDHARDARLALLFNQL